MTESFWIALIVGVGSPLLLALLTNWSKSRERAEDRAERAANAKRAEDAARAIAENLKLVERNTNSMTTEIARMSRKEGSAEGERKGVMAGEATARTLAEGQRQGRESAGSPLAASGDVPVPVVDDVAGRAAVKSAAALESLASSAKKTAEDK